MVWLTTLCQQGRLWAATTTLAQGAAPHAVGGAAVRAT